MHKHPNTFVTDLFGYGNSLRVFLNPDVIVPGTRSDTWSREIVLQALAIAIHFHLREWAQFKCPHMVTGTYFRKIDNTDVSFYDNFLLSKFGLIRQVLNNLTLYDANKFGAFSLVNMMSFIDHSPMSNTTHSLQLSLVLTHMRKLFSQEIHDGSEKDPPVQSVAG